MATVISLKVTEDQLKRARSHYDFGALKGSITQGKSNIYGAVGEVIVHDFLKETGRRVKFDNTADYDMIVNGNKVDVKTKRTTVPPLQSFNCSIAAYNTTQKCDLYVFARVHENLKEAWVLGWEKKEDFFKKAKFHRKGQPDPKTPAWKFAADCYNLEISKLTTLEREK